MADLAETPWSGSHRAGDAGTALGHASHGWPQLSSRRRILLWAIAAIAACILLAAALVSGYRRSMERWSSFLAGDPQLGARLFFDRKGCARCHSINGFGGKLASDLGYSQTPDSNFSQLVTSMWNHAPRMWERIRNEGARYPVLDREEMAHLLAFLYTTKYLDEPGNVATGRELFVSKGCSRCHEENAAAAGPAVSAMHADTPILWAQAMWNHAPAMETRMTSLGLPWVRFDGREMIDLLAFIRENSHGIRTERSLLPASPAHGWDVFRKKSCIECHAVNGQGGHIGPELGPNRKVPLSLVQFAGLMWNHSPQMFREMQSQGITRPTFEGQEIADLVAFLSSIRFFEPGGAPEAGQSTFADRGCSRCHGQEAEGTRMGPALRGRSSPVTSLTLASALWDHGPKMYRRTQELRLPWPTLDPSDLGNIISFLNSPRGIAR